MCDLYDAGIAASLYGCEGLDSLSLMVLVLNKLPDYCLVTQSNSLSAGDIQAWS